MSLVWTLTYTQLATPLELSMLFSSKEVAKIHPCVVFGSSVFQDVWMSGNCMALYHERFWCHLPSSIQKCTLSFSPIPKIPKIISYETVYSPLSCFALCYMQQLRATSSVYCSCVMRHAGPNKKKTLISS